LRILIADDHETVRKGLCSILGSRGDVAVCGEATNGREAVEQALRLMPDLAIMDITMPTLDGLSATRQLVKLLPDLPVLILSMHDNAGAMREAQAAGARGYISKGEAGTQLFKAIDAVLKGGTFFPRLPAQTPSVS
jgi:DNA-binding NarL/FixJ family response regulator